jgi:hypothetical protein
MRLIGLIFAMFCLGLGGGSALAAGVTTQVVTVGGVQAILLTPAKPHGAIVLMTGGPGQFTIDAQGETANRNSLVRNRMAFANRGFAVLVPEGNVDVAQAVDFMRKYGKVTLVGTSRGTERSARGIAAGARPDRLVLTSGLLSSASGTADNVENILGSPANLPPTLIVHNRFDQCHVSLPAGVDPFIAWAGGKARVTWLQGGVTQGDACEAMAYHGFNGIDGQMVSAVAGFAAR